MSVKLEKIGADLERARDRWKAWEERTRELEQKYADQENAEICEITHSYNLNPDQLAYLLELAKGSAPESTAVREDLEKTMPEKENTEDEGNEEEEEIGREEDDTLED